jgi:hypothetical protein
MRGRVWRLQASPNMSLGMPITCFRWGGSELRGSDGRGYDISLKTAGAAS